MRLNSVRLTNFRLHADTRIDFESGLTGIIGPNGSGKTTILEAIAWALYGMPAARGKRQGIRSLNAPGRAGVADGSQAEGRSGRCSTGPGFRMSARSMTLRSSLTLPGHE